MSAVERLRESISERLSAVSDEICAVFEATINRYRTQLSRQRKLLDVVWNPDIRITTDDLSVLSDAFPYQRDLRLLNQQQNGSPPQEQAAEPPQPEEKQQQPEEEEEMKQQQEEEEEPHCSNQGEEEFPLQSPGDNQPEMQFDEVGKMFVKCGVCGKAFKFNFHLKRHLRRHSSEKPYACRV